MNPISKILIIVDETPLSETIAQYGYSLASQLHAEVALLHVENSKEYRMDMVASNNSHETGKTFINNMLENLSHKYSQGIATKIFVVDGNIKESVLSTANQWNAQLIVAGKHQHSGIGSLFKENTSENILQASNIPMMIIPEKSTPH
ncbi:universal stress protein [Chryseobacterium sp.]|uniref:universal stress protein n=1 Tax=Chryseobacterium sp. TaxID=1871047 RepID=UPI0033405901